jgi:hypothetical protein
MASALDSNQIPPLQREPSVIAEEQNSIPGAANVDLVRVDCQAIDGAPTGTTDTEGGGARRRHEANVLDLPHSPGNAASAHACGRLTDQLDWMRLSDALNMLSANARGLTKTEKKLVLCRWISNHEVDTRLTLPSGRVLEGFDVYVPPCLVPEFFDWKQSRPMKPWLARPGVTGRHALDLAGQCLEEGRGDIALIELKADQLRTAINNSSHRFAEKPVWQVRELLGLLINPDRALFGLTADDDLQMAARYKHGWRALTAVLHKLQQGLLIAHEDGNPLSQIRWIDKTQRDVLAELDFRIFAESALAVWPELPNVPETARRPEVILAPREVLELDGGEHQLRPANDRTVHEAITAIYDKARADEEKPPNVKQIVAPVQVRLRFLGYWKSGRQIQKLAEAPQHKARRRKPGVTVASEKRPSKA